MFPKEIRGSILAYALMSLGGLMLHLRIHPPEKSLLNWIPLLFGLVNLFVLPFLFSRAHSAASAYMICCVTVIAGTVGMIYYSITNWKDPVTLYTVMFNSTLCDIIILFAKLPLGYGMLKYFRPVTPGTIQEK